MSDDTYDVAVVGYGPAGLTAASLLGRLGHSVVVIERWPSLYGLPRATHVDDETARILQAAADVEAALRDSSPTEYHWLNGNGERLLTIPVSQRSRMGYPEHISMYQPDIEDAIDGRVRALPKVTVLQGWQLTGLDVTPDDVTLIVDPWRAPDREQRLLRAGYLIAADGANSTVRELLGIEREDFGFNERWLNIDAVRRRPLGPEFDGTKQFCDPARGYMSMAIGRSRQRFEWALLDGESIDAMTDPEVGWRLLHSFFGLGPEDLEVMRQLVYVFESRVARRWSHGRVYLAGDAAHTMPPYLGQGACSGMRDALNLAWKLSLVLDGKASPELLDTYESERRPHATELVRMAIELGKVANMHDPEAAAERDAALVAGHGPPPPTMPELGPGVLRASADGVRRPEAGRLSPQGRIAFNGSTGLVDDVIGLRFALIARRDCAGTLGSDRVAFLERLGCAILHLDAFADLDRTYAGFLDELSAEAVLVRPDFYVFGTATDPRDICALVDDLQGALCWASTPAAAPA